MTLAALNVRSAHFLLTLAFAALCLTGCPSSDPKKPGVGPQAADPAADAKDSADAIAALKAKNATLNLDKAGNVGEVILSAECTNDDLKHVAALPHCVTLSAEVRGITGEGLAHLKGHPALKNLRLEQSDVKNEDAKYLLDIPKLDDLDLKKTDFTATAYETLSQHKTLRKIRAPQTKFDNDCLKAIAGMKQLVALDLTDCNLVTSAGCASLAGLANLEMLKLYGRDITDEALEHISKLQKLKVLGLAQSAVSKEGLDKLANHPTLKELDLYGCQAVNNAAIEKVGTIANLEILVLRETAVKNDGMQHLVGLKKLKELDLSESNIGIGKNFEAITQIQSLVDFNVWSTSFTDADMPAVGQLKNLKKLNLDKTEITDMGLANIKELENLEYIHLGNSMYITDAGLAELHGLKKLKTVIVTFVGGVTDDGVAALQAAIPGVEVKR